MSFDTREININPDEDDMKTLKYKQQERETEFIQIVRQIKFYLIKEPDF